LKPVFDKLKRFEMILGKFFSKDITLFKDLELEVLESYKNKTTDLNNKVLLLEGQI
jgi:hypothetical protein